MRVWKLQAFAQDFVTVDDKVVTCELRFIEDLVDEVSEIETDCDGESADICG